MYINEWVSRVTKNNIKDLLPEDGVSQATKLVLANAAYFKGVWASKFPKERTKKEAFFVSETRQTLVPFMKQKGTFHYSKFLPIRLGIRYRNHYHTHLHFAQCCA